MEKYRRYPITISPGGGELGLRVDGDVRPGRLFWTQKSGQKITKMEAKNPGDVITMNFVYLFSIDIDGIKSNHWHNLE